MTDEGVPEVDSRLRGNDGGGGTDGGDGHDGAGDGGGVPCQNCGAELLGPHCYRCGQPVKGLVRHFTSVIGDFFDSVFDFDSRTLRTLWPLFGRPGYLSCEYFEGRRVRYVSPVRLFFFLTIVAFFVGSLTLHMENGGNGVVVNDDDSMNMNFGDGDWDPVTNPVDVSFLPPLADAWINDQIGRAEKNIGRLQEDPDLYVKALLSAVPTALFVLLPVFALMLKLAYVFKRRLYMEHLIVALHSHAFLSLSLLLLFLLGWLERALPAAAVAFNVLEFGLFAWMPLYLLLMQKRVYGQGWPMTLLKYLVLGFLYFWLISLGAVVVALGSLVWM